MTFTQKSALFLFLVVGVFGALKYLGIISPLVVFLAAGLYLTLFIRVLVRHMKKGEIIEDERDRENGKKARSISFIVFFIYMCVSFSALGIIYDNQPFPRDIISTVFIVGIGVMLAGEALALLCLDYLQTEKGARFTEKYFKRFLPKNNISQ